jgi:hypothetical protein
LGTVVRHGGVSGWIVCPDRKVLPTPADPPDWIRPYLLKALASLACLPRLACFLSEFRQRPPANPLEPLADGIGVGRCESSSPRDALGAVHGRMRAASNFHDVFGLPAPANDDASSGTGSHIGLPLDAQEARGLDEMTALPDRQGTDRP